MQQPNKSSLTDTPAFKLTNAIYRWFAISCLWFATSIPIITIGAASTAAIAEFASENDENGGLVKSYFRNFRKAFPCSSLAWLAFLLLSALIIFDFSFYRQLTGSKSAMIPVAALILIMLLLGIMRFFMFSLASSEIKNFRYHLKSAFRLLLRCMPVYGLMVVTDLVLYSLYIRIPYLLISLVLVPGLLSNIHCLLIKKALARYE